MDRLAELKGTNPFGDDIALDINSSEDDSSFAEESNEMDLHMKKYEPITKD